MPLAIVYSRAQLGAQAPLVTVEVHLSGGLPSLSIVGLPETAVRESKDRVRSALLQSGFEFPVRRITINLAPADLPKQGGRYDLAIALGILAASEQIERDRLKQYEFVAELALSGALRPVRGVLPCTLASSAVQRKLICANENAAEGALADDPALVAGHLLEVSAHLAGVTLLSPAIRQPTDQHGDYPNLRDVRGQPHARRALEIAAAGSHSLLLVGPPGTGKTLLASRLPGILPPLTNEQALESAAVTSISRNGFQSENWRKRPFRTPHHSASSVALVGGGSDPQPGEISLAHHGVLFLDELPEFKRSALEVLREPLENGSITISRAAQQTEFPARFQLVAAMNPCPCGYLGDPHGNCHCSRTQIQRYQARISGPLLDRIDLQIHMPRLEWEQLNGEPGESSDSVLVRVNAAREIQRSRNSLNAELSLNHLETFCKLGASELALLEKAMARFHLSPRGLHRIRKVARTIADLSGCDNIQTVHLQEAIGYRCLEHQSTLSGNNIGLTPAN